MIYAIKTYPDPILTIPCAPVTKFNKALRDIIQNMFETLYHYDGLGLAAPQVGMAAQIAIVDTDTSSTRGKLAYSRLVLINPRFTPMDGGEFESEEGCLSIPGQLFTVKRHKNIYVEAQDVAGRHFQTRARGMRSVVIQHEIDHLSGILINSKAQQGMLF